MNKNSIKHLSVLAVAAFALSACTTSQSTMAAYQSAQIECMGVEHDGSQTLRVTASGRNKADAVEQAKKNAVREVIFNGIRHGQKGCNMHPIVAEANAEEKYENYFNIFFADGGEYLKYISMADERNHSRTKAKAKAFVSYTITVRVLRAELKDRLKADHVID